MPVNIRLLTSSSFDEDFITKGREFVRSGETAIPFAKKFGKLLESHERFPF
jgi:hypothetical protein